MQKGFTLIELLLYVGLAAGLLLASSFFYALLLQSRTKNQVIAEVESQGQHAMQLILQTIRNAENINSPITGNSSNSLSLDVVDAALDPTNFDQPASTIRIKEGVVAALELTNQQVQSSGLDFRNLTRAGTPGTIRVQFTLTYTNPENRFEYNYVQTFYGTATLRD